MVYRLTATTGIKRMSIGFTWARTLPPSKTGLPTSFRA